MLTPITMGRYSFIPLTSVKGRRWAKVDAVDAPEILQYKWNLLSEKISGRTSYAVVRKRVDGKRVTIRMHRLILAPKDGFLIDHRDRNGLNNTRENLRYSTRAQNAINVSRKHRVKGASFDKRRNRWQARININGKNTSLGFFKNQIDATAAYRKMAKLHHGEFAI
jgi:hypothetical protein